MQKLIGYQPAEMIDETTHSSVFRAVREIDGQRVIIKLLRNPYPDKAEIAMIRKEYDFLCKFSSANIVRCLGIEKTGSTYFLVMVDDGAISLSQFLRNRSPSLDFFYSITKKCLKCLAEIHEKHIVHKDINPKNIIINPESGEVRIIDFGISTELSREKPLADLYGIMEGSIPYISPEQTGRINRFLDYRTDYYSLGMTFFEIITGKLPFRASDTLGYIHAHIAKKPPKPSELGQAIPSTVDGIILKMIAKNPEERYQSIAGILHDLEKSASGQTFSLGEKDISEVFHIPEKLYGREKTMHKILSILDRVSKGYSEVVTITGQSGIGKTSVIDELGKSIIERNAYIAKGKFDQLHSNIPYAVIKQILQQLYRQLISQPSHVIENIRTKVIASIDNFRIIREIAPELASFLAQTSSGKESGLQQNELQNRHALRELIRAFSSVESPVIICLDDVQWADQETLSFVKDILFVKATRILFILSYRDQYVDNKHILSGFLDIYREFASVTNESLTPLSEDDISNLLTDCLHQKREIVTEMARYLARKTDGNPFYIKEILDSMYQKNIIFMSNDRTQWSWDHEKFADVHVAANVVEFMIDKMGLLSREQKSILHLAACVGHLFDVKILSFVVNLSHKKLIRSLWELVSRGFLLSVSSDFYYMSEFDDPAEDAENIVLRFVHDRIQQAAYSLDSDEENAGTHLKIARIMLDRSHDISEIVRHYNLAGEMIVDKGEKILVAGFNRDMARQSRTNNAYQQALAFAQNGITLVAGMGWEEQSELFFDLNMELLHANFFLKKLEEGELVVVEFIRHLPQKIDQARIYYIVSTHYNRLGYLDLCIKNAVNGLALLSVNVKAGILFVNILSEFLRAEFSIRFNHFEKALQPHSDERVKLIMALLTQMQVPAAYVGNTELAAQVAIRSLNICLNHGCTEESAVVYFNAAIVRAFVLHDMKNGKRFMEMGLALLKTIGDDFARCSAFLSYIACVTVNFEPHAQFNELVEKALVLGYKAGDLGTICAMRSIYALHNSYDDLCRGLKLAELSTSIALEHQVDIHLVAANTYVQNFSYLIDSNHKFDHSPLERIRQKSYYLIPHLTHEIQEAERFFLIRDFTSCAAPADFCRKNVGRILHMYPLFHSAQFFLCLIYCEFYRSGSRLGVRLLWRIKKTLRIMRTICAHNKDFDFYLTLMEAEFYGLKGDVIKGLQFYRKAVEVNEKRYLKYEAIACEMAGRFCMRRGLDAEAVNFIRRASYCYHKWGGETKVELLRAEFEFLQQKFVKEDLSITTASFMTLKQLSKHRTLMALDLPSYLKVSQDLAQEVNIDKLSAKLIHHAMENAGAEYGSLLIRSAESNDLYVATGGPVDNIQTKRRLIDHREVPVRIIEYVRRTRAVLIIDDASGDLRFAEDEYIHTKKTKSVLSLPILHQQNLVGIIYLENNLSDGAFRPERIEVINMIASLAAVSIENAQLYQSLEEQIDQRTRQLRTIFNNIKQGIFTINRQGRIDDEYSDYLNEIFPGAEIRGASGADFLLDRLNILSDQKSLAKGAIDNALGSALVSFHLNAHLLPREAQICSDNNRKLIIALDWMPIVKEDNTLEKILVTIKDITDIRSLEKIAQEKERQFEIVREIVEMNEDQFNRTLSLAKKTIKNCNDLIEARSSEASVKIMNALHTLKGVARAGGLAQLASEVHQVESIVVALSHDAHGLANQEVIQAVDRLATMLMCYEDININKLKRVPARLSPSQFGLREEDCVHLLMTNRFNDEETLMLRNVLARLFFVDPTTSLKETAGWLDSMAQKLSKKAPQLKVKGGGIYLNTAGNELVGRILPLLINNSLDHGIESEEDRRQVGKAENGCITIEFRPSANDLEIIYHDDGRGLDLANLRQIAIDNGILEPTAKPNAHTLANLIFIPELSTKKGISTISGRGFGMGAIKQLLQDAQGEITVELVTEASPASCRFHIRIPRQYYLKVA